MISKDIEGTVEPYFYIPKTDLISPSDNFLAVVPWELRIFSVISSFSSWRAFIRSSIVFVHMYLKMKAFNSSISDEFFFFFNFEEDLIYLGYLVTYFGITVTSVFYSFMCKCLTFNMNVKHVIWKHTCKCELLCFVQIDRCDLEPATQGADSSVRRLAVNDLHRLNLIQLRQRQETIKECWYPRVLN